MVKRIRDDRREFFEQLSVLVEECTRDSFPKMLTEFMRVWIPIAEISVLEFRKNMQPIVVYRYGEESYDHDMKIYIGGMYLLDPFYLAFEAADQRGVLHIKRDGIEDVSDSKVYRNYFNYMRSRNEVGTLHEVGDDACIHLSIFLNDKDEDQIERTIGVLHDIEPMITTLFKMYYRAHSEDTGEGGQEQPRQQLHRQIVNSLMLFGSDVLTKRELTVVQNLLRGHSAKSMARILNITPGTISIHRSNIYRKMNVTSQAELSSMFLHQLIGNEDAI
jgi:DNA-binding CsgD family transcriptional regulator